MCTVTILPEVLLSATSALANRQVRLRLACNRDELLTRAPALPPIKFVAGARQAVMPIDPESGGTWIGANDAALVCVVLNVYNGGGPTRAELSRGTIVPALLHCEDVDGALARALELPADRYAPFRLLISQPGRLIECTNLGGSLDWQREQLDRAWLRTSSGLGDDLVAGPRKTLFTSFFEHASDPVATQDLFHLHQWRGRESISVRMRRLDARTVSHTVVEVTDQAVTLTYRPAEAPDGVVVTMAA
jgi:hypothetical protein